MRTVVLPSLRILATAATVGSLLFGSAAHAQQEVKSLRGKPSSAAILEALTPATAPSSHRAVRTRGLSLGTDDAEDAGTPQETNTAPQPQAPASKQPQAQQPQAQARALDLEIKFQFNSGQLTEDGKEVLDQLGAALKSDKLAGAKQIVLEGHADAKGNPAYNQALSLKRAQSARNYLALKHGIPSAKLKAVGKGSSEPVDPNNPQDEINRRVRVIVDL